MSDFTQAPSARTRFIVGTSVRAIGAAMMVFGAQAAVAQAAGVPDPAGSSSSQANPNEPGSAEAQKAANSAVTGDVTPAQNEAAAQAASAAATDAGADDETADIVVTGFRAALENAVAEINIRRKSSTRFWSTRPRTPG